MRSAYVFQGIQIYRYAQGAIEKQIWAIFVMITRCDSLHPNICKTMLKLVDAIKETLPILSFYKCPAKIHTSTVAIFVTLKF